MNLQKLINRNLHKAIKTNIWEVETLRLTYYKESIGYKLQLDYLPNKSNRNVIKHITKTYLDIEGKPLNEKYQAKFDRIEQMLEPYNDVKIKSTVNNALFKLAWEYLNNCTYFAKPYRNSDGKIISFGNEFQNQIYIGCLKEGIFIENGCFSLTYNSFYHDPTLTMLTDTFENAIILLYNEVLKRCGEDYIDDYFYVEDIENLEDCMTKLDNGNYTFEANSINSYWEVDKVLDKLKKYEEEIPSI